MLTWAALFGHSRCSKPLTFNIWELAAKKSLHPWITASQIKDKQLPHTISLNTPRWSVFGAVPWLQMLQQGMKTSAGPNALCASKCRISAGNSSFPNGWRPSVCWHAHNQKNARKTTNINITFPWALLTVLNCRPVSLYLTLTNDGSNQTVLSSIQLSLTCLAQSISLLCYTRAPHHHTSPLSAARRCQLLTNSCSPRSLPPFDRQKLVNRRRRKQNKSPRCLSWTVILYLFWLWGTSDTYIYLLSSCLMSVLKIHLCYLNTFRSYYGGDGLLIKQTPLPYMTSHWSSILRTETNIKWFLK